MKLHPETVLRRAGDIKISIASVHTIEIMLNGQRQHFPNQALVVLAVFAQPLSLGEGLKRLQSTGMQDWIQLTALIIKLRMVGALSTTAENEFAPDKNIASFGSAPIHIAMLNDKPRTNSFISGLQQTVKEGDIVVDIGTGTGILAIAAARAGAKKVYAVEVGAMADVAQAAINSTEVVDKITLVRGWSTQIELPEKADVLVSETIGNDPFDENILQIFRDAHSRLLKPGARLLPGVIKVWALPVIIPPDLLQNAILQQHDLSNWKEWYNVDFSALQHITAALSCPLFKAQARRIKKLTVVGEPLLLTEVDLTTFRALSIENEIAATVENNFNGFLVYFEAQLGKTVLSTHPSIAGNTNSWASPVWYLPEAVKMKAGDNFKIRYKYAPGNNSEIFLARS